MTLPQLRRLHRWVAIVVAAQFVLWSAGGVAFAWLDHERVGGDARVAAAARPSVADAKLAPLADTRTWREAPGVREIRLEPLAGRWVYRIDTARGVALRDATDGTPVAIDAEVVRALAAARHRGDGTLAEVRRHDGPTQETRGHDGPVWEARYEDADGTRLWFAADDGRLLEVRTDAWRLYDVFWMLHTMDYRGRDDFNHPLVVLAGTSALWVALTGLLMAVRLLRRGPLARNHGVG